MRIVKVSKKDEQNVIVYLDSDEKLYLSYEVFLENGLKKNDEISESRFSFLVRENQKYHIKQRAWRYLGRRMHAEKELKLKLAQKGYERELINIVVTDIKSRGYLNDYQFASQFTDENLANKLWGKVKVKAELMKKGIDIQIVDRIINEKFPEGNLLANAIELASKKYRTIKFKNYEPNKLKLKLLNFLASRGYDYETSKIAVDNILKGENI